MLLYMYVQYIYHMVRGDRSTCRYYPCWRFEKKQTKRMTMSIFEITAKKRIMVSHLL